MKKNEVLYQEVYSSTKISYTCTNHWLVISQLAIGSLHKICLKVVH